MPFKEGDLVILKSGGAPMTVEEVHGQDISCVWSDGKKVSRDTFSSAVLKPYNDDFTGF